MIGNVLIENEINNIRNDLTNGSTTIARHALEVFALAVSVYNKPGDMPILKEIARRIALAKPGMAAPKNIINICMTRLEKLSPPFDFSDAKREILVYMDSAARTCTDNAANLFMSFNKPFISIITCSFSSTVIKAFIRSRERNINLVVLALDSKWKDHAYGRQVVEACKKINIAASVVPDNEMDRGISQADLCFTGADAILPDGSIVNGVPSLTLAKKCQVKIPFHAIAESFKQTDEFYYEPGFDIVPAYFITQIITDHG